MSNAHYIPSGQFFFLYVIGVCGFADPFFVEFQCTAKLLFMGDIPPLVQHDQDNSDLSPKLVELKGASAENSTCGCRNHVFNCNQVTLN